MQAKPSRKPQLLPVAIRHTAVRVIQIYITCLLVAILLLFPLSHIHIENHTKALLNQLETELNEVRGELSYLLNPEWNDLSCEQITTELRKQVFQSDIIKEIGLFNPQGRIYCTNNSSTSFFLYQTILDRLKSNSNHVTLSYTRSKLSRSKSVALIFTNEQGKGVSVLIPPRYLLKILNQDLEHKSINYRLQVISREIQPTPFDSGIQHYRVHSKAYPLDLEISTSIGFYFAQLWHYFALYLICSSLLAIGYLFRKQRKESRNSLETSLRYAIENDYLELHYQPIVNQKSLKVVGCEALLRWNDPVQGFIPPSIFIPLAEKVGLIEELTKTVVNKVSQYIKEQQPLFLKRYISLNVSRSVILKESMVTYIEEMAELNPQLTQNVVLEITEDNNFTADELTILKLNLTRLSSLGFRFAVDDFGTGYSGLDFIRQFPFAYVKIDRVFIKNLHNDSTIIPVLESMMTLARQLNMITIVEGVEEQDQLEILDKLGFVYIQGFYYSKPLAGSSLVEYLSQPCQPSV